MSFRIQLIDDWAQAYRKLSVIGALLLAALSVAYNYLPVLRDYFPANWVTWMAVAIIVGRVIKQSADQGLFNLALIDNWKQTPQLWSVLASLLLGVLSTFYEYLPDIRTYFPQNWVTCAAAVIIGARLLKQNLEGSTDANRTA